MCHTCFRPPHERLPAPPQRPLPLPVAGPGGGRAAGERERAPRCDARNRDRNPTACLSTGPARPLPTPPDRVRLLVRLRRAGLRLASTGRCCPLRLAVRLPRHTPAQPRSVVGCAGRFSSVRGIRAWPRTPRAFSAGRAFAAGQRFHLSGAFGGGPSAALLPRSTLACSPFASSRRPVCVPCDRRFGASMCMLARPTSVPPRR